MPAYCACQELLEENCKELRKTRKRPNGDGAAATEQQCNPKVGGWNRRETRKVGGHVLALEGSTAHWISLHKYLINSFDLQRRTWQDHAEALIVRMLCCYQGEVAYRGWEDDKRVAWCFWTVALRIVGLAEAWAVMYVILKLPAKSTSSMLGLECIMWQTQGQQTRPSIWGAEKSLNPEWAVIPRPS